MIKCSYISILIFFCLSCSVSKSQKTNNDYEIPQKHSTDDFKKHLVHLGKIYQSGKNLKLLPLKQKHRKYLESLAKKILNNNELLLKNRPDIHFSIVDDDIPVHFSLPNNQIFLSKGLINKHLKHEGLLIAITAYELLRSQKGQYRRNIRIPIGHISTKDLVEMLQIPLKNKLELNRWVFYILKRSGHDPHLYLMWIQMQNKNAHEFALHLGNLKYIAREEYEFKNFISKQNLRTRIDKINKNSSKEFYYFRQFVANI